LEQSPVTKRQDRSNLKTRPEHIAGLFIGETWRAVVGFNDYFVSTLGRVCSVDRIVNGNLCRGQLLQPGAQKSGHLTVALGRGNSRQVHALVLTAFVGPCPEGHEGLHGDDNPAHNWLSNLRWGTRSDNLHDAVRNGKRALGENIKHAKLTEDGVRWIRANPGCSMNSLAEHLGVSCAAVKQVRDGITWAHVT
jgi:hypothetical protein